MDDQSYQDQAYPQYPDNQDYAEAPYDDQPVQGGTIKKHGKKLLVGAVILAIIIVVVVIIYIKLYPSTMQMTGSWWNYAPDAPTSDTWCFVSFLSYKLKVGSVVTFSNVVLNSTPAPCQTGITQTQVANDFQTGTYTVTSLNRASSSFVIIPTGGTGVKTIDNATWQCYTTGLITIS